MAQATPRIDERSPPTAHGQGQRPPAVVAEELGHLARTRRLLTENPEGISSSEEELARDLIRLRDEMRTARTDDRAALHQQMSHLTALLEQVRRGRPIDQVDPDSPYFAHLQLDEGGRKKDIFLGRATRLSNGLRIVDWRNAPISRLFYRYQEGDEYSEEMASRVREGHISARRTLHIENGDLLRVDTPAATWVRAAGEWTPIRDRRPHLAGGEGLALRSGRTATSRLGSGGKLRADKHLPDIAALIDPAQFELITAPDSGVVVLGGTAGSGKTTVALHRIAYLAFNGGPRFDTRRVLVVVWGRAMRDYVAHVLPALGVEGVEVTTWTDWARRAVAHHYPRLPGHVATDTPEPVSRVKLHPAVAELLETRIRSRRASANPTQAIEDWARLVTDRGAIARAMGADISESALDRAMRWTTDQVATVMAWLEGDGSVDARLDAEDDALLLRAHQLRVGPLRRRRDLLQYQHMVLDEVQDFSPIEVQVLLETADARRSVTLAGDTRQHISQHSGFTSWQEFLDRIGIESKALSTLEVSYRSTQPIIRFAVDVLDDDGPPPRTTRDGPPVELLLFSEHGACVAFLAEELKRLVRDEQLANVALLTPTPEISTIYAEGLLKAEVPDVRLVKNQCFAFAPGIDVVEADQVKGLEFDYVVIVDACARYYPDTPHHRRLLHVAATRAVHQLWLTTTATPSPILPALARSGEPGGP